MVKVISVLHSSSLKGPHAIVFATRYVKLDFEERASRACFVQDGRVTLTVSAV